MSDGEFSRPASLQCWRRDALFGLDARRLDDRPPFLDLGLLVCVQRLRRLLLAREYPLTEVGEPRTHYRIRQRTHDRGIQSLDHIPRRALGRAAAPAAR